jgi:hypothetical protein
VVDFLTCGLYIKVLYVKDIDCSIHLLIGTNFFATILLQKSRQNSLYEKKVRAAEFLGQFGRNHLPGVGSTVPEEPLHRLCYDICNAMDNQRIIQSTPAIFYLSPEPWML